MKTSTATFIAGMAFTIVGLIMWQQFDAGSKMLDLGVNLMGSGIIIVAISALQKIG